MIFLCPTTSPDVVRIENPTIFFFWFKTHGDLTIGSPTTWPLRKAEGEGRVGQGAGGGPSLPIFYVQYIYFGFKGSP